MVSGITELLKSNSFMSYKLSLLCCHIAFEEDSASSKQTNENQPIKYHFPTFRHMQSHKAKAKD